MQKSGHHISIPLHRELGRGLELKLRKRLKEIK